jgi:hypothetical protein
MWSARHSIRRMSHGKILRLIIAADATIVWSDRVHFFLEKRPTLGRQKSFRAVSEKTMANK